MNLSRRNLFGFSQPVNEIWKEWTETVDHLWIIIDIIVFFSKQLKVLLKKPLERFTDQLNPGDIQGASNQLARVPKKPEKREKYLYLIVANLLGNI